MSLRPSPDFLHAAPSPEFLEFDTALNALLTIDRATIATTSEWQEARENVVAAYLHMEERAQKRAEVSSPVPCAHCGIVVSDLRHSVHAQDGQLLALARAAGIGLFVEASDLLHGRCYNTLRRALTLKVEAL